MILDVAKKLGLKIIPTQKQANGVTGHGVDIVGVVYSHMGLMDDNNKLVKCLVLYVVRNCAYEVLLGVNSLRELGKIILNYTHYFMMVGELIIPLGKPAIGKQFKVHASRDFILKPPH